MDQQNGNGIEQNGSVHIPRVPPSLGVDDLLAELEEAERAEREKEEFSMASAPLIAMNEINMIANKASIMNGGNGTMVKKKMKLVME